MCKFGKYISGKVRKISGRVSQYRCITPSCGEIVCTFSSRYVNNCKVDLTSISGNILLKLDCPNGFERYYLIPSEYLAKQWLFTFNLKVNWIVSPENLYLVKQNNAVIYRRNPAALPNHPLPVLKPITLKIPNVHIIESNITSKQINTSSGQKQKEQTPQQGRNTTFLLIPLVGLALLFLLRR